MKKLKQMYRCIGKGKYRNNKTTRCPTKTFGHDRQYGFTLVELVIVIAIVIILSVISVPIYRGYIDKAKYSEAYAFFGAALSAAKAYYSEHGNFLASKDGSGYTSYDTIFGIDTRGNKYFKTFLIGANEELDVKNSFRAAIARPNELVENGTLWMYMYFKRDKGTKIGNMSDFDSSWFSD